MRRIGVLTTSYPRWPGDYAGNFVEGHVRALEAAGFHVDVIAARPSDRLFYRGGAPEAIERGGAWPSAIGFTLAMAARALRHRWDGIVAHWLAPSAIAALPARVPLLAIAHGGDVHLLKRIGLLETTLRLLRLRRTKLAFVSEELRAIAARALPWAGDAIVQPMGVDTARFAAIPRAPDGPTIFACGRLVPVKGFDVAVDALAHLHAPARLVIAGDGPARDALAHRGATLLGAISTTERDRWLGRASVVVVPSRTLPGDRSEGTPLIALEALAAGVPVVGSRVGGLADLPIEHVDADDPRALARAIDRVLANPPPRVSLAHLDWARVATVLAPSLRNDA